ncbi:MULTISPECIES: MFS transporter [Microbacterium]|uniref:MFS transporter n=1 Tax=Microbacterium TaxID=33882 RepID=UPI000C48F47D|nr:MULTISPECIES: MFS transporter [Microbacterium]MAY49821.1 MFS transporter [Microbacterium sp.]HAS32603.1 MFS transporter [Microbacterium sp.]HBR88638.1 MFS transporter [Microbacterium sp.]|tara:strand:+ start:6118 stop:7347 length:1230 start_codon:yes stop_codon:yes gene_type:complete
MSADTSARSALAAYRTLPARAGWGYLIATSLGRLPLSMMPLAILTLVSASTGSIALAGAAAAAAAVGEAIGAPTGGALSDRFGQRPVLLTGVVLNVAFAVALVATIADAPDLVIVALAGATGLSLPQVGPLSRVRWMAMSGDDLSAAFAFEGVTDEVVYIIGPAVVGILAVTVSPEIALLSAAGLIAVFVTQFALHPTARFALRRPDAAPADAPETTRVPLPAWMRRSLGAVVLGGMLAMGTFFGASQAGLTSFALTNGLGDSGSLLYAVMAVGSAVTTVAMVAVPDRIGLATRWVLAGAGMALGAVGMMLAPNVVVLLVWAVLAGAFQGPALLTMFSVAGSIAQPGRAGILMTLTGSGVVLGVAIGTSAGGALAAGGGPAAAFALVATAAGVLALLGAVVGILIRPRR